MQELTPREVEQYIKEGVGAASAFDFQVTQVRAGYAEIAIGFNQRMTRLGGTVSGPVMMTAADTAMYAAVIASSENGRFGVTSHMSIDFLRRPAPAGLVVRSKVLRLGRRAVTCAVEIYSETDLNSMVAHATGSYILFSSASRE